MDANAATGPVLSTKNSRKLFKRLGLCPVCGQVRTHTKSLLGLGLMRRSISSDDGRSVRGECRVCLFAKVFDREEDDLRARLASPSSSIRRLARRRDWRGWSMLHVACGFGVPVDVVRAVHELDPSQATHRDRNGMTPLHCAFSLDVVRFLLGVAPETAAVGRSADGALPLHSAVQAERSPSIVRALLRAHPAAARATTRAGASPLDLVVERRRRRVLAANGDAANDDDADLRDTILALSSGSDDADARCSVHRALRSSPPPPPDVVMFLLRDAETFSRSDDEGDYPLHIACSWRPRTRTVARDPATPTETIARDVIVVPIAHVTVHL